MAEQEGNSWWGVYLGAKGAENFERAISQGVWGVKDLRDIEQMRAGDRIVFVLQLVSDRPSAPPGWPRVHETRADQFRGKASSVVEGRITSDVYQDFEPFWSGETDTTDYPHRFRFQVLNRADDVEFNDPTFPAAVVDAVRRSASDHGTPQARVGADAPDPPSARGGTS